MISTFKSRSGCHDHPPYLDKVIVQDGWTADGRRRMVTIDNPMEKPCQYRHTTLGKADGRCEGCKWRDTPVEAAA